MVTVAPLGPTRHIDANRGVSEARGVRNWKQPIGGALDKKLSFRRLRQRGIFSR
jgi:hypothetical protein